MDGPDAGLPGQPGGDPAAPVDQDQAQAGLVPAGVGGEGLQLLTQHRTDVQAQVLGVQDPVGVVEGEHGWRGPRPQVREDLLEDLRRACWRPARLADAYFPVLRERGIALYSLGHGVADIADLALFAVAMQERGQPPRCAGTGDQEVVDARPGQQHLGL